MDRPRLPSFEQAIIVAEDREVLREVRDVFTSLTHRIMAEVRHHRVDETCDLQDVHPDVGLNSLGHAGQRGGCRQSSQRVAGFAHMTDQSMVAHEFLNDLSVRLDLDAALGGVVDFGHWDEDLLVPRHERVCDPFEARRFRD